MTIGVTGGVASGKSTVLNVFAELGANTVDADAISRRLTEPGKPLTLEILRQFGDGFALRLDPSAIDRTKLASVIFHQPELRKKLESIMHPPIVAEIDTLIAKHRNDRPNAIIAVEVPLLFEVGLDRLFRHVLVVWCSKQTQLKRLKARLPQLDYQSLIDRISSQMPLDDKRAKGDFVLDSEKTLEMMRADIRCIYDLLMQGTTPRQ